MHAFDQLVFTGLSMPQAQGPKANAWLGNALVDRGGAKGWRAGVDVTGALRVEVSCGATRDLYSSSMWGGGTRHQMTQAPAGVRKEEELPCCLEPSRVQYFWAVLDASTRCGEGRARRARTETKSCNAAPMTREPSQDQSSTQEAQRKAQISREVIFTEMAMKDAWRSWEGRRSHLVLTHHSLSCALIFEQERQLLSQFSICSTHPSGYLWLQSPGLAPQIGRIGCEASRCVAPPTRSSQSTTCGRRWHE